PAQVGQAFDKAILRLHHLLPEMAGQRSLLGIMTIGAVTGWVLDGDKPHVFHPLIFQGRSFRDDQSDRAVADERFNRLERGADERVAQVYGEIAAAMET